jgi:uncharacterized protein YndB with AHSA1/START domain
MADASKFRTIRQQVVLPGTPEQVYSALMTTKGHRAFTGTDARISPKVGGRFMAWGGFIHGTNLELVPGKLILQSWVPSVKPWPPGHASIVRYELAKCPRGTRVTFTHSKVPEDHAGHLADGWKKSYWVPLRTYLPRAPPDGDRRSPRAGPASPGGRRSGPTGRGPRTRLASSPPAR